MQKKKKICYDKNITVSNFKIGDYVLIKYESRRKNPCPTHGPYKIVHTEKENSTLNVNNKLKTYHNNTLKLYQKS